jgi:hypothetical protein
VTQSFSMEQGMQPVTAQLCFIWSSLLGRASENDQTESLKPRGELKRADVPNLQLDQLSVHRLKGPRNFARILACRP